MSEGLRGKSETEIAVETFVDRMVEIHEDLDREEFYQTINQCVQDAVSDESEEESDDESDDDEE